jgi:hypothetical protein
MATTAEGSPTRGSANGHKRAVGGATNQNLLPDDQEADVG